MHSVLSLTLSRTAAVVVLTLLLSASPALAQDLADQLWTDVEEPAAVAGAARQVMPSAYRTVQMDGAAMASLLAQAPLEVTPFDTRDGILLSLPTPEGGFASFRVVEAPVMAPGLQARYPEMRTYFGRGVESRGTMARISSTPEGFHALVLGKGGTMLVDPMQAGDAERYMVYRKRDYVPDQARALEAFGDEAVLDEAGAGDPIDVTTARPDNGEELRTYRLAMAATGEYTTFHSTRNGRAPNVADALDAIVVAMTRVNGIYERDLSVRMVLIDETDQVIYTSPTEDPYTNNNGGTLLGENQANLDAVIGSDNYDIGHVFSTGGGGVASLGSVCRTGLKARGVTGLPSPINDIFYVDFVSHEMGHQFRGNHSFNGSAGNCSGGNRNGSTAYEPGSGSTIMAYAGICAPQNLQNTSDDYFHTVSLIEIVGFIGNPTTGGSCAEVTPTGNVPPVVMSDDDDLSIPIGTPFVLTGSAEDDDNDPEDLTYTWEEFNLGPAGPPAGGAGWNGTPPFFRSFDPVDEPVRYFPSFARLLTGNPPLIGEGLPMDEQRLRFRFTARDNAGGIADIQVQLQAVEEAGPFVVTFANEEDLVFGTGSEQEITWDVAGTDAGEVNTPTVDILFAADGDTFDTVLAEGTENDGSEVVTMPSETTSSGRIMVRAVDNVFFAVNDEEFALETGVANEARPEAAHALSAVYPNPFGVTASRATINLQVEQTQAVRVAVYDALGRQVAVLYDGALGAGQNRQLSLDATMLSGGTYFVRVVGETFTDVRQMTVVR